MRVSDYHVLKLFLFIHPIGYWILIHFNAKTKNDSSTFCDESTINGSLESKCQTKKRLVSLISERNSS